MTRSSLTALICDHHLDPRLRKRKSWLKNAFGVCDVYVDPSRGEHFQAKNEEVDYQALSQAKLSQLKQYDLIYISGAKIVLSFFIQFVILRYIYKVNLVYEIPDLPLRSHSKFRNSINSVLFYIIVKILFKRVVITSKAFLRKLPSTLDYFECENLPSPSSLASPIVIKKAKERKLTISFVGVIRYLSQMELLIEFASLHDHIKVKFHGGPDETVNKLKALHDKYGAKGDVEFFGKFETSELAKIYSDTDFIYSVYDSKQDNVKLALPNKLYESIIYSVPLIVSTDTFLHERVLDENNGFGVDSQSYEQFEKDMFDGIGKKYQFNYDKLKYQVISQESLFLKWLNNKSEAK
ncbi:glycosyltransferase [Pseudoalteromonas apostichopi]|uniref:glycosyltransferase n=1 Tax=Pseudoalteromonas apostichopi TaxID=3035452 RepID=UPI0025738124|nr:glycosyltransferase [Pseudoalteromonas sp. FE4]